MSNTRTITALVAFIATFIFSAGLVRIIFPAPVVKYVYMEQPRSFERRSNDVEAFLLRDITNGSARMDDKYSDNYAQAVTDYWKASSSMDASGFPEDFQKAWRSHMQAWGDYAEYLQAKKSSRSNTPRNLDGRYSAEINRTWEEVLRIGRTYGSSLR